MRENYLPLEILADAPRDVPAAAYATDL